MFLTARCRQKQSALLSPKSIFACVSTPFEWNASKMLSADATVRTEKTL